MAKRTAKAAPPAAPLPERNETQEQIAALRLRGMTLEIIAQKLGVSMYTVSRWKTGKFRPIPILAKALADLVAKRS